VLDHLVLLGHSVLDLLKMILKDGLDAGLHLDTFVLQLLVVMPILQLCHY